MPAPPAVLTEIAAWIGPIGVIVSTFVTIIGAPYAVYRARSWFLHTLLPRVMAADENATAARAESARTAEGFTAVEDKVHAVKDSIGTIGDDASAAARSAATANEAVVYLAEELAKANARSDYVKEHNDRLVGALAAERAGRAREIRAVDLTEWTAETSTVTGRHLLHPTED